MLCGKMEKMAGTGSFHKINKEEIACLDGTVPIVKKLTEILGVNIEVIVDAKLLLNCNAVP